MPDRRLIDCGWLSRSLRMFFRRPSEVVEGLFFADPGRALWIPRKVYSSGWRVNSG